MKNKPIRLLSASLLGAFMIALCLTVLPSAFAEASAATSDPSSIIAPETAGAIATPFIVALALKYPITLTIIAVIGALRFFFKPLISLVEAYVRATPQQTDNEYFDKVSHSPGFRWFAWLLDFGASIKVGPQFTAEPKK